MFKFVYSNSEHSLNKGRVRFFFLTFPSSQIYFGVTHKVVGTGETGGAIVPSIILPNFM